MMTFKIEIPLFMFWESARTSCLTSGDWDAAFIALQAEMQREVAEDGSTRVYQMLEGCLERLKEKGHLRRMTDEEIESDAACPFYESSEPRDCHWIVGKAINYTAGQPSSWEFQGVFDSKEAGVEACRDENYFIGLAHLNEVIPHETTPWEKVWYPKLESEPSSPSESSAKSAVKSSP